MRQLLTRLRTWPAPRDAWQWLPEFEGLPPAVAEQTWTAAHREIRSDHWTLLSWCGFLTGVFLLIERFGTASSGAGDVLCFMAGCWMLGVPVQLGIRRRTRNLVARRLGDDHPRGGTPGSDRPARLGARHGAAALLLGLTLPLLPSCGETSSVGADLMDALHSPPTASAAERSTSQALHQLLDEGRFAEVRRLVADRAATPRLSDSARALYEALAQVGFGDCQAAVELTEQADDPLSERDREVLLSRSIQLMATWDTRHDSLPPVAKLGADSRRAAESRWDAAHCLLDHARERYPWREQAIERCRDQLGQLRWTAHMRAWRAKDWPIICFDD